MAGVAGRRLSPRLVGASLVIAAAVAAAVVALTRGSSVTVQVVPNSVAVIDPDTTRVVADVPVGGRPIAVASGAGSVWVVNSDQTLVRIYPGSREIAATIDVGLGVFDVAVAGGSVWVANGNDGAVSEIDPPFNAVTARIAGPGNSVYANVFRLATGGDTLWGAGPHAGVVRIDPQAGAVVRTIAPRLGPAAPPLLAADVAATGDAVWLTTDERRLLRIDPGRNRVTRELRLGGTGAYPRPVVAVGFGSVWATTPRAVWRIDPGTNSVADKISLGTQPVALAVGAGAVWVGGRYGDLIRIDPRSGTVSGHLHLGQPVSSVVVGSGEVWAAVSG
jgi:hypothetical protein